MTCKADILTSLWESVWVEVSEKMGAITEPWQFVAQAAAAEGVMGVFLYLESCNGRHSHLSIVSPQQRLDNERVNC